MMPAIPVSGPVVQQTAPSAPGSSGSVVVGSTSSRPPDVKVSGLNQSQTTVGVRPGVATIFPASASANVSGLQSLGLMITNRFPASDARGAQTIFLPSSRPANARAINPTGVTVSGGPAGVPRNVTIATTGPQQTTAIPIRAMVHPAGIPTSISTGHHGAPGAGSGTVHIMNLSVANPNNAASAHHQVKQITTGGRQTIQQMVPLESLNLVVTGGNDLTRGHHIRLPSGQLLNMEQIKTFQTTTQNAKMTANARGVSINSNNQVQRTLSITTTPANIVTVATGSGGVGIPPQQIQRVGIINNQRSVINLKPASAVILNPAAPIINSSGVHQVVGHFQTTSGGAVMSNKNQTTIVHPGNHPTGIMTLTSSQGTTRFQPTLVSTTANNSQQILTTQHRVITSAPHSMPHHQVVAITTGSSPIKQQQVIQQQLSSQPNSSQSSSQVSVLHASGSPMKQQQLINPTPPSPRPSILTRKRPTDQSNSSSQNSSQSSQSQLSQNTSSGITKQQNIISTSHVNTPVKIIENHHHIPITVGNSSQHLNVQPEGLILKSIERITADGGMLNNHHGHHMSGGVVLSQHHQQSSGSHHMLNQDSVNSQQHHHPQDLASGSSSYGNSSQQQQHLHHQNTTSGGVDVSTTPRKKPRKQVLDQISSYPLSDRTSANFKLLGSSDESKGRGPNDRDIDSDDDNDSHETGSGAADALLTPAAAKKPRPSLLPHGTGSSNTNNNNNPWKSLQYHFLRYSDVRPKPEKKLTLSELSNEGLQKKNGWKIHHLATQMEQMSENETEVYQRLNQFLESFETQVLKGSCNSTNGTSGGGHNPSGSSSSSSLSSASSSSSTSGYHKSRTSGVVAVVKPDPLMDKLSDLLKGNLQRSSLFSEQINESKSLLVKLTNDHRERVAKLTRKNMHKRTCISSK